MRLFLHDFTAYAYPTQLARELARRGHDVTFAYCPSNPFNPGGVTPRADDPDTLTLLPIPLDKPLEKFNFVTRWRQENAFGRDLAKALERVKPDVVMSSNAPLDVQRRLWSAAERLGIPKVFWLQDVIGIATHRIMRKKLPLIGELIGRYYLWLEALLLRRSERVVMITEDFRPILRTWNVADERMLTVENWAPLDDLPMLPRADSNWAREVDAVKTFNYVYAGTMGMKHNPALILALAERMRDRPDVRILVLSQGKGADWLREKKAERNLPNLQLLPYVPIERMPEVLAAADVLVAVLEPDAGVFSVPSKVLAYLCGGKPVVLAVPPENLIARIIEREGAGRVVGPSDVDGFVREATALADDTDVRVEMGRSARAYAERTFAIEDIADRFEQVFAQTVSS